MTRIVKILFVVSLLFVSSGLWALPIDSLAGFSVSGSVDMYYQQTDTKKPLGLSSFTSRNNSFELGMVNLILGKEWTKGGVVVDLAFGPRATEANGYAGTSLGMVKQLYVYHKLTDRLTFTLGNFSTFIGYELIEPSANLNYRTSMLFSNGPFYHTGIKADYDLGGGFGLMMGVFNDTDAKFDVDDTKHVGGQLSYAPGDAGSIAVSYLGGKVQGDAVSAQEHQIDVTGVLSLSEKLSVGANASMKSRKLDGGEGEMRNKETSWYGMAFYGSYVFSEKFTLAGRYEHFSDEDKMAVFGDMEKGGAVNALTLSGNVAVGPLKVIPEISYLTADEALFPSSGGAKKGALAGLIALVYSF